jgi:hypothetical protein
MTDKRRNILVCLMMLGLFTASVTLFMHVMPQPLRSVDYLLIGGASTMVCMGALFLLLIATTMRMPDTFFRRR